MKRVKQEVLKDVENQLYDFMISVDGLNVAMDKLLGQGQENMEEMVAEGYTVTVSPASAYDLYTIDCPAAYVVRVSVNDTSVTRAIAAQLSVALAIVYENTRAIEKESK